METAGELPVRLFVETVLEPSALDQIWSTSERLRTRPSCPVDAVRWVKRDAIHLTLRFLGEAPSEQSEAASAALTDLAGGGRFDLRLTELGAFGGRQPRVIFLAPARDDGFERLLRMRARLDAALGRIGFDAETNSYRPHITLGRVRRQATRRDRAALRATIDAATLPQVIASVKRVALVESTLLSDGPRYRRLAWAEL